MGARKIRRGNHMNPAKINRERCLTCGGCIAICPSDAIKMSRDTVIINVNECIGCGLCIKYCALGAISQEEKA